MDPGAVSQAILAATQALRSELMTTMEGQNTIMKAALDTVFDNIRNEAKTATAAGKTTFELADAKVREDYDARSSRLIAIKFALEGQDLEIDEHLDRMKIRRAAD